MVGEGDGQDEPDAEAWELTEQRLHVFPRLVVRTYFRRDHRHGNCIRRRPLRLHFLALVLHHVHA